MSRGRNRRLAKAKGGRPKGATKKPISEAIELAEAGLDEWAIAKDLKVSVRTVKRYLRDYVPLPTRVRRLSPEILAKINIVIDGGEVSPRSVPALIALVEIFRIARDYPGSVSQALGLIDYDLTGVEYLLDWPLSEETKMLLGSH